MDWDLLEKTTFWVEQIELEGANLGDLATAAAGTLGLRPEEVIVVDVRPGIVAFDVLRRQVAAEAVAGKETAILGALGSVAGVSLGAGAGVHSEGVLGLIALEPRAAEEVLSASAKMARQITETFPWASAPAYLVRDNDCAYGHIFTSRVRAMGIGHASHG